MTIFKKLPQNQKATIAAKRYGLLLVDDEADILEALANMLKDRYQVFTALSGEEGLDILARREPGTIQVVIADQRMPGMSGVDFLGKVFARYPSIRRMILTGYTDFQAAVQAINTCKTSYFLLKPFEREELFATLETVVKEYEAESLKRVALNLDRIAGSRFKAFLRDYADVATSQANVLIYGETGTGKELVARALHDNSTRKSRPFVTIHCGAIPETLFEAELFGHKRGAFTDAHADRRGRVLQAHGGTLFIDEVAEIPISVQAKLLRFFQSGEFQRVGADQVGKVDVRILAATHRNLAHMVAQGSFRQDLYYRLNVVAINLPTLRERLGDLEELNAVFLAKYNQGNTRLSRQALMILQGYHFPGNVRELEHCIERGCALSRGGEIGPHHLPPEILEHYGRIRPMGSDDYDFTDLTNEELKAARMLVTKDAVDKLERTFLAKLLARFSTVAQAARHAGMARPYLHRLITRHGLRDKMST